MVQVRRGAILASAARRARASRRRHGGATAACEGGEHRRPAVGDRVPDGRRRGAVRRHGRASRRVRQPQHGIGRFDSHDNLATTPLPAVDPLAGWLTSDPSGAIWISERDSGNIGRLSPNGSIVEFPLPAGPDAIPQGSVITPGGILYVTEQGVNAIARLDPRTGHVTEFQVPTPDALPLGLTLGTDGALWFTERSADADRAHDRSTAPSASGRWIRAPFPTGSSRDRMGPSGSPSSSGGRSAACRWHGDADRIPDRRWAGRDHGRP